MARKRIIWDDIAKFELKGILTYWLHRNQSNTFSKKLNKEIREAVRKLSDFPYIGKTTNDPTVRRIIIREYIVFYEIAETHVTILTIWDGRRDPEEKPVK